MTMQVEVDAIAKLGEDLKSVAAEFESANADSDSIAEAVGHAELAEVVRSFAHGWDDKREKMVKAMKALGEAATQVAQTWTDFDQQGADTLNGTGEQPQAPARQQGPV
ncbi:hypothetical protein [Propionicimonas sp.]|uniref:hypothetical protein n=1 Tax=Propionicimonas sp. TaxID=1955623 RepID=UPI0025D5B953|nr:hypothetical protein [Propionicimonas sp.]MCG2806509.1 hypothetical protein [Propionicimonas sp.]